MARIRSRDTVPEKALRSGLHRLGLRFRLNVRTLPGKPDIVLPRYHTVIFVHGCFWHRHRGCKVATNPKSNSDFWQSKFASNVKRDQQTLKALGRLGWKVLVVWECELKGKSNRDTRICEIASLISEPIRGSQSKMHGPLRTRA